MNIDLSVEIGSLKLKNPVMVASGTFGYGEEYRSLLNLNGLAAVVTKTITLEPRPGNPPPRIAETECGMLNSIGLANVGVEAFIRDKLPFLKTLKTRVLVSVGGSRVEEFAEVVARIEDAGGVDGYELNVSCPNVAGEGVAFGTDADLTMAIGKRVRTTTKRPIMVKLTPNVTVIAGIARAAQEGGADGLVVGNTVFGMAVALSTRKPKLARIIGGYSGRGIKPIALAKVYEVVQAVDIPVVGCGGILNAQDALEFLITGARAVQIGTATFLDPKSAPSVIEGLKDYCRQHNINRITNLIGTLDTE